MNEIWANRLIAGSKSWGQLPPARVSGVRDVLRRRVESGAIDAARYEEITGEAYGTEAAAE